MTLSKLFSIRYPPVTKLLRHVVLAVTMETSTQCTISFRFLLLSTAVYRIETMAVASIVKLLKRTKLTL